MFKKNLSLFTAFLMTLSLLVYFPMQSFATEATDEMDKLIADYGKTTAVMVYSMDGTTLYSYNETSKITGASLIKLPYCYYVCAQIQNGVRSLDDTMTYTKKWYHGGSGIIRKGAYGTTYTVAQLIDYALRYSDNVAYDMLVYLFGVNGFNDMVARWGYDIKLGAIKPRFPALTADFMRESMRRMYIRSDDGGPWTIAWDALLHSTDTHVRGVLGSEDTPVAVKYGNVSAVWHETCYIDSENPYILVVFSSATNYSPNVEYLQNVASCADRINQEHVAYVAEHPEEFTSEPETESMTEESSTEEPTEASTEASDPTEEPSEERVEPTTDQSDALIAPSLGDINADGQINALDAQYLLEAAALIGAGEMSGLDEMQTAAADLNTDDVIDASDAETLLEYAAYLGAGGTDPIDSYLGISAMKR